MVGDGFVIDCLHLCSVPLSIQGHHFVVDFHVLPISGADVVLGVQWLKELSPIVTDYQALTMSFIRDGTQVEIHSYPPSPPLDISAQQVKHLVQIHAASAFFHIQLLPTPKHSVTLDCPDHPNPHPSSLLHKFQHLFTTPTGLPPDRPTNHQIHLDPNASSTNIRPYRYPHFQK